MPILDHFGILAPFYERLIPLQSADPLIELLKLPVRGAILDAGGGTGRVASALSGLAEQVVVADVSIGMLQQAVKKKDLHTVCGHSERLPFPGGIFERVLMVDALHHVCSQTETAAELWRVLKPGGRIVIEEPNVSKLSVKFVALFEKIALMRSHFLSPVRIAELFNEIRGLIQVFDEGAIAWVVVEKNELVEPNC
jgi:ubiquinone/menaquinone biosynthesis C-methylase UbiE